MKQKRRFRFPIIAKTITIIFLLGIVLVEIAMIYFSLVTSNEAKKSSKENATSLSQTVALTIDLDETKALTSMIVSIYDSSETKPGRDQEGTKEFEEYMAMFEPVKQTNEYKHLQSFLNAIKVANKDTDGIYLGYVDYTRKKTIYVVYDQENEFYPTGIIDDLYEEDYPLLNDHHLGFVASIFTDEATKEVLVTAGSPIIDPTVPEGSEDVVCYALVDITMTSIRANVRDGIVRLFVYMITTVFLISIIGVIVIYFLFLRPINTLRNAALAYDTKTPEKNHEVFSNLKLYVHDEIDDLAQAMKKMEDDVYNKIDELTKTNEALVESQQYAEKMTELANKDALTGVRNKAAYNKFCEELDAKIKAKEAMRFGVAMVDLNYLKNINDEYGHDNGDIALIKVSTIICGIFAHSPVFRLGGDEFVIILRNKDYGNAKTLIQEFNDKIDGLVKDEDLLPYEQVSAAIGYSKYDDEKDTCVDDVFKRADKAMYTRKREMKKHN